jgi:hypothetical protein
MTGTYDPDLNLLYWGTGNPHPVLAGRCARARIYIHMFHRRDSSGYR